MRVYLTSFANKELSKLPSKLEESIVQEITKLVDNPHPVHCKKLSGKPGWRIRVGDYRIIYSVDYKKKEVMILAIAHRREVYR